MKEGSSLFKMSWRLGYIRKRGRVKSQMNEKHEQPQTVSKSVICSMNPPSLHETGEGSSSRSLKQHVNLALRKSVLE
jgi:hypothetical protein